MSSEYEGGPAAHAPIRIYEEADAFPGMGLKLCLALAIFYPTFGGGSLRFMRYQPGLRKRSVEARVLAGTARTKDAFHEVGQSNSSLGWEAYPIGGADPDGLRRRHARPPRPSPGRNGHPAHLHFLSSLDRALPPARNAPRPDSAAFL